MSSDFTEFLLTRKPTLFMKNGSFSAGETTRDDDKKIIAPLNTDISDIVNTIPPYSAGFQSIITAPFRQLPGSFSWAIPTRQDSKEVLKKKANIHPVFNQSSCGSCWAVSISTVLSDCFAVSGTVDWCPLISPTFLMMSLPITMNKQCLGGSIANALKFITERQMPLADSSCIDYSWCDKFWCDNPVFNSSSLGEDNFYSVINKIIPPFIGCYSDVPKWGFKADKDLSQISTMIAGVEKLREVVKTHILDYGPALGSFIILKNFSDGDGFAKFNGGVYFDRADYTNYFKTGKLVFNNIEEDDSDTLSSDKMLGTHSVAIVGWGIEKNVQYDNDKVGDVPYWHVRNSWGSDWGENGFFKMAMYPFNRISQFEKPIKIRFKNSTSSPLGSIILIKATSKPEIVNFGSLMSLIDIFRVCPSNYYSAFPAQIRQIQQDIALRGNYGVEPPFPHASTCLFAPNPPPFNSVFPAFSTDALKRMR
jgi:hypothetical protein